MLVGLLDFQIFANVPRLQYLPMKIDEKIGCAFQEAEELGTRFHRQRCGSTLPGS